MSSLKFASNILSLNAQRRLGEVSTQLRQTSERLSSGLRINRASDDAAGLAISESLKADQRVFNQGIRNFNDGISLLSIADSNLESLSSITIRLKELAEQAANGVYGSSQRKAMDKEAQVLAREFVRIAQTTRFNDLNLLSGSLGDIRIQGGAGTDGGIVSGIGGTIGNGTFTNIIAYGGTSAIPEASKTADLDGDGNIDIVGATSNSFFVHLGNGDGTFRAESSYFVGTTAISVALGDFNGDGIIDVAGKESSTGNGRFYFGNGDGTFRYVGANTLGIANTTNFAADANGDGMADVFTIYAPTFGYLRLGLSRGDGTFAASNVTVSAAATTLVDGLAGDFNQDGNIDIAGLCSTNNTIGIALGNGDGTFQAYTSYAVGTANRITMGDFNSDGFADLVNVGGGNVDILYGQGNGTFQSRVVIAASNTPIRAVAGDYNGDGNSDLVITGAGATNVWLGNGNGTFSLSYTGSTLIYSRIADFNNDGVLDSMTNTGVALGGTVDGTSALLPFSLSSVADARQALPIFDRKIQQIAAQRAEIGAFDSRIQSALSNLGNTSTNYAEANSRIADADVAEESAKLLRLKILQQSAASVLAQSNLQPRLALELLSTSHTSGRLGGN